MTTVTVTEARAQLFRLLDRVAESHESVLITGKRANAILVSEEDCRAIQETMYLLGIPGMRQSIVEGIHTPLDECLDLSDSGRRAGRENHSDVDAL